MRKEPTFILSILILIASACLPALAQENEALAAYNLGQYEKAVVLYEKVLRFDEQNAGLWNQYALALQKATRWNDSEQAFGKAIRLDPSNSNYPTNLSLLHLEKAEWSKAETWATRAISANPSDGKAYFSRCSSRLNLKKLDGALEDCDTAIGYARTRPDLYVLKSEILMKKFMYSSVGLPLSERIQYFESSLSVLEKCLKVCTGGRVLINYIIEERRPFYDYYGNVKAELDGSNGPPKSCVPLRIVSKPRPGYTADARSANINGTVLMMVEFKADATIGRILLIDGIGGGLNEKAIRAARGIKFEPESCEAVPKTVVKTIGYRFSVY